ncbi:MAG: hypothetical protein ACO294_08225 [Methylococcales bacterium]
MKTFQKLKSDLVEKHLTSAEKKKREEIAKAIHRENPGMPMAKKMAIATAQAEKVAEEVVEEESGQHYCASHVYSNLYGEGVVVEGAHADPDENGNIEWYLVEFKDCVKKVYTEKIEIMIAEYHDNHKKKKKKAVNG